MINADQNSVINHGPAWFIMADITRMALFSFMMIALLI